MIFSYILFGLLMASAFAQRAPVTVNQMQFEAGKVYTYELTNSLLSGIPELANQYSGFKTKSLLRLTSTNGRIVTMKLEQIKAGKFNGVTTGNYEADIDVTYESNDELTRHLAKPVRFMYENGLIREFEVESTDPIWSVNIKKSILSQLNINLHPKKVIRQTKTNEIPEILSTEELKYYGVYERSVIGICETTYEINSIPYEFDLNPENSMVLNVTKVRNTENCLTEPNMMKENHDLRGCAALCRKEKSFPVVRGYIPVPDSVNSVHMASCPCKQSPESQVTDQYNFINYNISLHKDTPVIESFWSEGKIIYEDFGDKLVVITKQNATLKSILPIGRQITGLTIVNPVRHEELAFRIPKPEEFSRENRYPANYFDIPFFQIFGNLNMVELRENLIKNIENLVDNIVSGDISASKETPEKLLPIVNTLAILDEQSLEITFEKIAQPGLKEEANNKEQIQRQIYLDALALSGSNKVALFIKKLILQNLVTPFEGKQMVEAIPQNLFLADTETMDAYLELCVSPKVLAHRHLFASTCLAFAKMVREGCVKEHIAPGDLPDSHNVPHALRNNEARKTINSADPRRNILVPVVINPVLRSRRDVAQWEDSFNQDVCEQTDVLKYVQTIKELLEATTEFHQKTVLVETLAHMSVPEVLKVLEPYISGRISKEKCPGYKLEDHEDVNEECNFLRTTIIYSLTHVSEYYPKQVLPLLLPVYRNPVESYEVRIAAFTVLLTADPDTQILTSIASELHRETNRQVISFVASAFEHLANFTVPCYRSIAESARQADDLVHMEKLGVKYSKLHGINYYDEEKKYGLYAIADIVQNNISSIPRAGYLSLGESDSVFSNRFLELGFNAKGLERFIERITEPNGILTNLMETHHSNKQVRINKRSTDSVDQALEALKEKLNFQNRVDDDTKLNLFVKLFEQTSYYSLDEKYIREMIDVVEESLVDVLKKVVDGWSGHFVKVFMPASFTKMLPSHIGLPVFISHKHPIILSLKIDNAKLQMTSHPRTPIPVGFNLTAMVQPQVMHSSLTYVFAVTPSTKYSYGTRVERSTQVNLPLEVSLGLVRPKNLWTLSIIPQAPKEVFYHKSEAKTFIAKTKITEVPSRDWLEESTVIKSLPVPFTFEKNLGQELFGIGLKVEVNSEDEWLNVPFWRSETAKKHGLVAALVEEYKNPGLKNREIHVTLKPDEETPTYGVDFTFQYKWIADEETGADSDDSDESSESNESDSDESDESSSSESSESTESGESNSKSNSRSAELKTKSGKKVKVVLRKMVKNLKKRESGSKSADHSSSSSQSSSSEENNEKKNSRSSSSESKSTSRSDSKSRSGSSSSSSSSSSSASSSSSSSESDESFSLEDTVFNFEDVMHTILGKAIDVHDIKKTAHKLIRKTYSHWESYLDESDDSSSSSSSKKESAEDQKSIVPITMTHDLEVTAVLRGPRPTYIAANFMYIHTLDKRVNWFKADGHIKSPVGIYMEMPNLFCAESVIAYPVLPGEFYYDQTSMMSQKANIRAELGWGEQCKKAGRVIISGVMEKTEDQVVKSADFNTQEGTNALHVRDWFYHQCEIDRSEGKHFSHACERALEEQSYLNQIILDIQYKNVPKEIQNLTRKFDLYMKHHWYANMENNNMDVHNPSNLIRLIAQYSNKIPQIPLFNIRIEKPNEITEYKKIFSPYVRPVSTLLPLKEVYMNLINKHDNTPSCVIMEKSVRTFDNVTYDIPETNCQYLVAMDCSPRERFTVYATEMDEEAKTKNVRVIVDGKDIKLLPPQQQDLMQIQIDGVSHELTFDKPLTYCSKNNCIRVFLRKTKSPAVNPIAVVHAPKLGLKVLYDGKNIKVLLNNNHIKGKMCGLCGNMDSESDNELVGPSGCLYEKVHDFINAYSMGGSACEKVETPVGKVWCPKVKKSLPQKVAALDKLVDKVNKVAKTSQGQLINAAVNGSIKRACEKMITKVYRKNDLICFSTQPVLRCSEQCSTQSRKEVSVDFHCLSAASPSTLKLASQAEQRVLSIMANKRVDLKEIIQVPVNCLAA